MRVSIDTNILVRFFARDDKEKYNSVSAFFRKYEGKKGSIFLSNIVVCELIWVLRSSHKFSRESIIDVMYVLLQKSEFAFENRSMLFDALVTCKIRRDIDFSDVLIAKIAAHYGASKTYSFDKGATGLKEFEIL